MTRPYIFESAGCERNRQCTKPAAKPVQESQELRKLDLATAVVVQKIEEGLNLGESKKKLKNTTSARAY